MNEYPLRPDARRYAKLVPGAMVRKSEPTRGHPRYTYFLYLGYDAWLTDDGQTHIGRTLTDYYFDRIMGGWAEFVEEET